METAHTGLSELICHTKKKENHHDNPVKGEWFLLCIELVV